ncbi:hypothetical protein TNCV_1433141 [Trichonephila clavipes]|nr:hypothetical protein TNCV_1433141 [Trichonephila clavipes]
MPCTNLEEEVENIVRSHNYIGKHEWKAIGGTVRKFARSTHVVSLYQIWTSCDEHESLYESRVGGYPLQLRSCQRKWTCCCSIVWGKISNKVVTESSNVYSSASEPGGTWIFQNHG